MSEEAEKEGERDAAFLDMRKELLELIGELGPAYSDDLEEDRDLQEAALAAAAASSEPSAVRLLAVRWILNLSPHKAWGLRPAALGKCRVAAQAIVSVPPGFDADNLAHLWTRVAPDGLATSALVLAFRCLEPWSFGGRGEPQRAGLLLAMRAAYVEAEKRCGALTRGRSC